MDQDHTQQQPNRIHPSMHLELLRNNARGCVQEIYNSVAKGVKKRRNQRIAAKRHKNHKRVLLWILCVFVAIPCFVHAPSDRRPRTILMTFLGSINLSTTTLKKGNIIS